jgi:hypothetical protein
MGMTEVRSQLGKVDHGSHSRVLWVDGWGVNFFNLRGGNRLSKGRRERRHGGGFFSLTHNIQWIIIHLPQEVVAGGFRRTSRKHDMPGAA